MVFAELLPDAQKEVDADTVAMVTTLSAALFEAIRMSLDWIATNPDLGGQVRGTQWLRGCRATRLAVRVAVIMKRATAHSGSDSAKASPLPPAPHPLKVLERIVARGKATAAMTQ